MRSHKTEDPEKLSPVARSEKRNLFRNISGANASVLVHRFDHSPIVRRDSITGCEDMS
jgi:hypothetical protein